MNKIGYLYVFDTMSDWEIGYITAELNTGRYFRKGLGPLKIVTVGISMQPVTSMGGLTILPDISVDECRTESAAVLILPGGNTWTEEIHVPILERSKEFLKEGIVIGAICGATVGLSLAGLLDSRCHTSNNLEYLKMISPNYRGEAYYKHDAAITDGNLVTASGIAPLEFTRHLLQALDVFSEQTLDSWYNLFKTQEEKYFFALMNSIA